MLKIGDFSKLSRISIRMLRHYDDMGLLKPASVDKFTGYRLYSPQQLQTANRISSLKGMGFSLSAIGEILRHAYDAASMKSLLMIRLEDAKTQASEAQSRVTQIQTAIRKLEEDFRGMVYDVSIKTLPKRTVAALRGIIPSYEREGDLWRQMEQETKGRLEMASPPYPIAIFPDCEDQSNGVEVEIQIAVKDCLEDMESVCFKEIEPIQVVTAIHKGSFETIGNINEVIAAWISDNGYTIDGDMFNIYHVGIAQDSNPANWVTEVCYPVRKED